MEQIRLFRTFNGLCNVFLYFVHLQFIKVTQKLLLTKHNCHLFIILLMIKFIRKVRDIKTCFEDMTL